MAANWLHGLEAAQVVLGYAKADVTQVNAERDQALAAEVMADTVIGCWLLRHKLPGPSGVLDVLMRLRRQDRERRNPM